jgi:all-trans-nonaprenyl-diphosphate synthase|uniref:Prenyl transferase n=1 Tax=Cyanidiaceae sp. MX-AZ01 TaxID=1503164 RepID=A0A060AE46_9RHOD|nr:prenyl transferase [Cyanidiaceae sp. MX-AZ01]
MISHLLIQNERNIQRLIQSRHPILSAAAAHLFKAGGKRIRPTFVLLISQAIGPIVQSQQRLAEITEMIHTASLLHDDVVDEASKRRGIDTVNTRFSNRIAVLAGDFLFAQSSWYLANLNHLQVVKFISKLISDLAEGEIRQTTTQFSTQFELAAYLEKSFYKTASLMACSAKAACMLGEHVPANIGQSMYLFGQHLGMAFQIMDDVLDITGEISKTGKAIGADVLAGNLTAPVLFALTQQKGLVTLLERECCYTQDANQVRHLVLTTYAIEQARDLAIEHAQAAIACLASLTPSEAKDALFDLTVQTISRQR